jgi:hypothetical protein
VEEKYFTVKLTLTRTGAESYRSRIEQSPLGASKGVGWDFKISPAELADLNSFVATMSTPDPSPEDVRVFGKKIFDLVFQKEVLDKYNRCLGLAQGSTDKTRIRLAITILTDDLLPIPWEYLYNGDNFLLNEDHTIIRVIDELADKKTSALPIQRLLVAIANPGSQNPASSTFPPFDAETHRANIEQKLKNLGDLHYEVLMPATKSGLENKIRNEAFDALYFAGHGTFMKTRQGQLILEKNNHPDPLDASLLARWLADRKSDKRVRFVYLNSCSTSKTDDANPFAGVAQRLMRDGKIDAAVAMQTDVLQSAALPIAVGFFDELHRGQSPEEAMSLARFKADDAHSWGVPVLYGHLGGSEEFERNGIARLLNAKPRESSFAFLLANFRLGVPVDDFQKTKYVLHPEPTYSYPGETLALTDARAAWDVFRLVAQIAEPEKLEILTEEDFEESDHSHFFVFGSKSNELVSRILENYSAEFEFKYEPKEQPGMWVLRDRNNDQSYAIAAPHKCEAGEYERKIDYGVIEKIITPDGGRTFFLISGLGDRATRGCGKYLFSHWKSLLKEFGDSTFRIILQFGGRDLHGQRISRKTGKPFQPKM